MTCPHYKKYMGFNPHGECENCGKHCGCSFDPQGKNDWCDYHWKNNGEKNSNAFANINFPNDPIL